VFGFTRSTLQLRSDTILLLVIGVDFALLWGVVAFLMSFIPNIGYIISLIPPLILAFLEGGLWPAVFVLLGYQLINGVIDSVIAPRYMGEGLDLSTFVTVVAVFFWAYILGPLGAFLALPMTARVKELILAVYGDSQGLAILMSASDGKGPPASDVLPQAASRRGA
jgi:AI-2 transport protein TqsA